MRHRLDGLRISEAGFATDAYAITSTVLKRPPAPPQLLSGGLHGVTNDWKSVIAIGVAATICSTSLFAGSNQLQILDGTKSVRPAASRDLVERYPTP